MKYKSGDKILEYKVGDKVRIKSIDWYNENKASDDEIRCYPYWFGKEHSKWCGKVMTISHVRRDHYTMVEDLVEYWTDEMIEGLVEEETKPNIIEEAKTYWDSIKDAWICPEGYIFKDENGNVINATKIVLEKKKKEYPTTIEECCEILGLEFNPFYTGVKRQVNYKDGLLHNLKCLLIYRDAYWKLYGEEMGLGKPFEPDWENCCETKYTISCVNNKIRLFKAHEYNYILTFPTAEMRDAFYENFKVEIESCKELL